jgi:hypothetical protein
MICIIICLIVFIPCKLKHIFNFVEISIIIHLDADWKLLRNVSVFNSLEKSWLWFVLLLPALRVIVSDFVQNQFNHYIPFFSLCSIRWKLLLIRLHLRTKEIDITIFGFHVEDHGRIDSSDGMVPARSLYTGVVEL